MPVKRHPLTSDQTKFLIREWPKMKRAALAAALGISQATMYNRAAALGLFESRNVFEDDEPERPILMHLGRYDNLTARLMGDPRPGRTPWSG